ncbi:MAG: SIR2 family protein [Planctomycetes bacterium]|nr:SIR2 family protein [Planctomycetota bacterium]
MRITAFVGAGGMVEIGGLTTEELTAKVKAKKQSIFDVTARVDVEYNFIEKKDKKLNANSSHLCSFEEILHVLEMLVSYHFCFNLGAPKNPKLPLAHFVKPIDYEYFSNLPLLLEAKRNLFKVIADEINEKYMFNFPKKENEWFSLFWKNVSKKCPLDIFTLNYDDCIEKSVDFYEDVYISTEKNFCKFDFSRLVATTLSRIMHVHGCILYGYPYTRQSDFIEEDFEDLCKFSTYEEAQKTWFYRSTNTAQSGEEAIMGPIITGLRKTDKLLCEPYSSYYFLLHNAILQNSRLLVIGYSFGDNHVNNLLEKFSRIHGANRKIVIITLFPLTTDQWHPEPCVNDWLKNENYSFFVRCFKERRPFGWSLKYKEQVISDDGCAHLYLCGFRKAVEQYSQSIIDFLFS